MSASAETDDTPVVLINVFRCKAADQQALVDMLTALARIQRELDGFVSVTLLRGLNGRTVANHAVWGSAADWKAMTRHPAVIEAMSPILAIATFEPNLYEPGEVIG